MSDSYAPPHAWVQPLLEVYTCAAVAGLYSASASRSAREATASQNAPALASQTGEGTALGLEDVLTAIATLAVGEDRVPDRIEVNRATDQQFMVRVFFVNESEYETYHIIPS